MAFAPIPPTGGIYDAQKRRDRLDRELHSPDPVERWAAREQRFSEELQSASRGLMRQAAFNAKIYHEITKEK